MKVNNKKYIIISLIGVTIIGIFFIWHKNSDNPTLDEVSLKKVEQEKGMFAIMLQSAEGSEEYTQSGDETWPSNGYIFNSQKSGCLDSDGKKIEGVTLSYEEGKVKVETVNTSYCYIYFDKKTVRDELAKICKDIDMKTCVSSKSTEIEEIPNLNNGNKGDLQYRYVGTRTAVTNNYICFGDTTCNGVTDNHMYRIIGITSEGKLKIIKNKATSTNASWNENTTVNREIYWDYDMGRNSNELFQSLNGGGFLQNETYIPQSSSPINWKNKIANQQWKIGFVQPDEIGKTDTGDNVWKLENATLSISEYEIGLMYLSDYYYSLDGTGNLDCSNGGSSITDQCKTSWLHINSNGETNGDGSSEWTMTIYGYNSGYEYYTAWYVYSGGMVATDNLSVPHAVRPVFYLDSNVTITSGDGSSGNPYTL